MLARRAFPAGGRRTSYPAVTPDWREATTRCTAFLSGIVIKARDAASDASKMKIDRMPHVSAIHPASTVTTEPPRNDEAKVIPKSDPWLSAEAKFVTSEV